MSDKILGLDIGIASCGFALVDHSKGMITAAGVHCFEKAEHPKDGSSLAAPRRSKRLLRRVIARRAARMRQLRRLFFAAGLLTEGEYPSGFCPWRARKEGLERLLAPEEFAVALLHIAKRRGFRSSKRDQSSASDPKEMGKLLQGTSELEGKLLASGRETIGEFLATLPEGEKRRNESGSYARTVLRSLHEKEVNLLFERQRSFGLVTATNDLQNQYHQIAFSQRPLRSTLKLVGLCPYEKSEKRAARSAPSAERFRVLQALNNLRLVNTFTGEEYPITQEQRVAASALATERAEIKYAHLRKVFKLRDDELFAHLKYPIEGSGEKNPETKSFVKLGGFYEIKKHLSAGDHAEWERVSDNLGLLDEIATVLTVLKDEEETRAALAKLGLSPAGVEALLPVSFSKHVGLSLVAIRKIVPFLAAGQVYSDACASAGYDHSNPTDASRTNLLPPFSSLRNPVVDRALARARKIVNAVIREYGMPDKIHIELARDVGKSFDDRRKIKAKNDERADYKRGIEEEFEGLLKQKPRPGDLVKYRLWKEQAGFCPYSQSAIPLRDIVDGTATAIDHIIPYSRSFDDSWSNKVLVRNSENHNKGNKTPFEYFGSDDVRWQKFIASIARYPLQKRLKLKKKTVEDSEDKLWKSRHLNDTRYITREFANHLRRHLAFEDPKVRRIFARSGQITSHMRWLWGLEKKRSENDKHHALDAVVVACTSEGALQKLVRYSQKKEVGLLAAAERSERLFPLPWDSFREDLDAVLDSLFVSRMPQRRGTGAVHKDTIRSERTLTDGSRVIVERVHVADLKRKDLDRLWDIERNVGVYEALKKHFDEVSAGIKKQSDPVHMRTKSGAQGPQIKSVVLKTSEKSGVPVRGAGRPGRARRGIASNGDMVRTDVFRKDGKFFLVPIYVSDIGSSLPNRAIVSGKAWEHWTVIDQSFQFMFSLYPNDYIHVVDRNDREFAGYYRSCDRSTGTITLIAHDNGDSDPMRPGTRSLKLFEKYHVDLLGRRFLVRSEKRHGLENRSRKQPRSPELREPSARGENGRAKKLGSV